MKSIKLLEKLKVKAVFKVQDIERIAFCDRRYAKLILNRLKKMQLIKRITKNTYTTINNIFVVATNIIYPSYLSFWSASYFLGYTEQILNTIHVATTRRAKSIVFDRYKIEFIPMKQKYLFGYKKTKTNEGEMFVAEDEKLLIDSFLKPKKCGNFDEIKKMFENSSIDKNKIISYLERANNQSIIKRVGFLLEKIKGIDISKSFVLDRNYIFLNPFFKKFRGINSKWRIKI